MIPLGFLLIILNGYGSYFLYSRPAHASASINQYNISVEETIKSEKIKHINDNKLGRPLLKYVYPLLIMLSACSLLLLTDQYYKGMAVGFALLFVSTYIIDNGFVSRSDEFLAFLEQTQ